MEHPFEKSLRAGLFSHTMQAYSCGHWTMIADNPGVAEMRSIPTWVPDPAHCDITELRLMPGSCDSDACRDGVDLQVITARILLLMIEAEIHLGSAMREYIEVMGLHASIPLNVRARTEHLEGCAVAHKQFSFKAMDWRQDPEFADRREAIELLCEAKFHLDEEYDVAKAQSLLATVHRAYYLSFGTYDLSRRASDSCMEMVELQERFALQAKEAVKRWEQERQKSLRILSQQKEGIKSRLRNAESESDDRRVARVSRARTEKRFSKIAKARQKDRKRREMYLTSGQWIARTTLNPRLMSLFT